MSRYKYITVNRIKDKKHKRLKKNKNKKKFQLNNFNLTRRYSFEVYMSLFL